MTSREWLRDVATSADFQAAKYVAACAGANDAGKVLNGARAKVWSGRAAALRALASRLDAEMKTAFEHATDGDQEDAKRGEQLVALLSRLDAALPSGRVMPGKETT